jgi:hypothetical protein
LRKNENSSEFLLIWEQNYTKAATPTKASAVPASATQTNNTITDSGLSANGTAPKGKKYDDTVFNQTGLLQMNKTSKVRATARISINDIDNFVKFDVAINDVPIELDRTGKDIVVDWFLMDDFDTNKTFWVDANGLEMVKKQLYSRRDYNYTGNGTVAGNYYPVTSAIAVRDYNTTQPGKKKGNGSNSSNSTEAVVQKRDIEKK